MSFSAFLRFIRWKNVGIVVLTLWAIRYVLNVDSITCPILSYFNFGILTLAFACIVAAGNMHNDMLDIDMDIINRPEHRIVGKLVSLKIARQIAIGVFVLGLLAISFLAFSFQQPRWIIFFIFFASLLFWYNARLKGQPLVGNLLISMLCGSVVLAPLFLGCSLESDYAARNFHPTILLYVYAYMAVLINFIRELIKDMEDVKGDKEMACRTFPVIYGLPKSRIIVYLAAATFSLSILFLWIGSVKIADFGSITASLIFILMPFVMFLWTFYKNDDGGYRTAHNWLKIVLLAGLLVLILI